MNKSYIILLGILTVPTLYSMEEADRTVRTETLRQSRKSKAPASAISFLQEQVNNEEFQENLAQAAAGATAIGNELLNQFNNAFAPKPQQNQAGVENSPQQPAAANLLQAMMGANNQPESLSSTAVKAATQKVMDKMLGANQPTTPQQQSATGAPIVNIYHNPTGASATVPGAGPQGPHDCPELKALKKEYKKFKKESDEKAKIAEDEKKKFETEITTLKANQASSFDKNKFYIVPALLITVAIPSYLAGKTHAGRSSDEN